METRYVAFDSHGVKAMCTRVRTPDVTITIDPGVAWETGSFPLSWKERLRLVGEYRERIRDACSESNAIVITHYHYDHHIPEKDPTMYGDKRLFIKDSGKNINLSQRRRGRDFLETVKGLPSEVTVADGNSIELGNTLLGFTPATPHGAKETRLGFVIGLKIEHKDESLFYSSDLNGILEKDQVSMILDNDSDTLVLDGPPTYLLGYVFSFKNLLRSIENLTAIVEKTKAGVIVLDHHLLRDYRYKELLDPVYKRAEKLEVSVKTAAEIQGMKPKVIEAYEKNGPTRWKKWEKTTVEDLREKVKSIEERED